jgi:phage terminase large subunit-like protein
MISAAPDLYGCETPRLFTPPLRELTPRTSLGFSFAVFCEDVLGLRLLPWQRWLAIHALELLPDGRFRFRTVLVLIARQNGKSTFLQALTLWFMWVRRAPMCLIAAQSLEKAEEVWAGAVEMAEGTPDLAAEMESPIMAAGKKELRTTFGSRCKVQTANRKGGRSLTADLVELDELREHHNWDAWAALTKTMMARANSQVWATSNAGDDLSVVLNTLRDTGIQQMGDLQTDFGIFEWSGPDDCDLDDPQSVAQANPALGYTITSESIAAARRTDPEWVFRTEVLCQRVNLAAVSPLPAWPNVCEPGAKAEPGLPCGLSLIHI